MGRELHMTTSEPSPEPTFGRYETLFRIASGGMAEVYAARARGEAGFEKLVALKRMLPHLSGDERFVTMFMDEARLAAHIASPHVVSTLDLGRASDGSLYLVMELVVGVTLHALARNASRAGAPIPVPVAVELLAQAAQGLHDAHEACTPTGSSLEIVHRDVSPQNILVGVDGRARLTDFGIARATERSTQTSTGEFKGKLAYCSPEQCANERLDRRADVFSLAIVGWELLTGERLFFAETPLGILEKVTRSEIREVADLRPEVPRAISDVIARGLRRARDERFATAGELEDALRQAARASGMVVAPSAIAELVRAHGGDALARIEQRLRTSLVPSAAGLAGAPRRSVPPPPPQVHDAPTVITPPPESIARAIVGAPVAASRVAGPPVAGPPVAGPPVAALRVAGPPVVASPVFASPVFASPDLAQPDLAPQVIAAPIGTAPVAARRAPLGIALLVIVLAGGLAGWLSIRGARSDAAATTASPAAPPPVAGPEHEPAASGATGEARADVAPDAEHAPRAPTAAQAGAARSDAVHSDAAHRDAAQTRRASRRTRASERRTPARDEPREAAAPRAATATAPPPPIVASPNPVAPPAAPPPRPAAEPRAAERRPREPEPAAERPRRSGLLSIDEFERDLGSQ